MPSGSGNYPPQLGNLYRVTSNSIQGFISDFLQPVNVPAGSWTRVSTNTPGFRSAFLKGKTKDLPMNPFSFDSVWRWGQSGYEDSKNTDLLTGVWNRTLWTGLYAENGTLISTPVKNLSLIIDLKLAASKKILSKFKNQDINLPVAVLEGRKTVEMIAGLATQLARAGLALRRGNFSGAANALGVSPRRGSQKRSNHQSLAENWLELQYGWKPLLNDIYGYSQYLEKLDAATSVERLKLTASSTRKTSSRSKSNNPQSWNWMQSEEASYTVKYGVYFTEQPGVQSGTALGLGNPAAVAWELVPFSFVADWIFPLGDFLHNLDATTGRTFIKGYVTVFWKATAVGKAWGHPPYNSNGKRWESKISKEHMIQCVSCSRTPLSAFPPNYFPILRNPFSTARAATALALMAQVFSGAPVKHLRI